MNAFLLILPLIFLRVFLMGFLNRDAYERAQRFAPLKDGEKPYYIAYQLSQLLLLLLPLFLHFQLAGWIFWAGLLLYSIGLIGIGAAIFAFLQQDGGLIRSGIYRFSRHPLYLGYDLYYLGIALLTSSLPYLGTLVVFVFCSHRIILAEEAWCLEAFGEEYRAYMERVRRYL